MSPSASSPSSANSFSVSFFLASALSFLATRSVILAFSDLILFCFSATATSRALTPSEVSSSSACSCSSSLSVSRNCDKSTSTAPAARPATPTSRASSRNASDAWETMVTALVVESSYWSRASPTSRKTEEFWLLIASPSCSGVLRSAKAIKWLSCPRALDCKVGKDFETLLDTSDRNSLSSSASIRQSVGIGKGSKVFPPSGSIAIISKSPAMVLHCSLTSESSATCTKADVIPAA
mmetsp:Transcript_115777/g.265824  ORF Transcript_115777/g.265824 Transcript_115777/m.265824 type:complete len:237 (+) Transcript_115777:803-1513(+)